jgi:hypothetical protein
VEEEIGAGGGAPAWSPRGGATLRKRGEGGRRRGERWAQGLPFIGGEGRGVAKAVGEGSVVGAIDIQRWWRSVGAGWRLGAGVSGGEEVS